MATCNPLIPLEPTLTQSSKPGHPPRARWLSLEQTEPLNLSLGDRLTSSERRNVLLVTDLKSKQIPIRRRRRRRQRDSAADTPRRNPVRSTRSANKKFQDYTNDDEFADENDIDDASTGSPDSDDWDLKSDLKKARRKISRRNYVRLGRKRKVRDEREIPVSCDDLEPLVLDNFIAMKDLYRNTKLFYSIKNRGRPQEEVDQEEKKIQKNILELISGQACLLAIMKNVEDDSLVRLLRD